MLNFSLSLLPRSVSLSLSVSPCLSVPLSLSPVALRRRWICSSSRSPSESTIAMLLRWLYLLYCSTSVSFCASPDFFSLLLPPSLLPASKSHTVSTSSSLCPHLLQTMSLRSRLPLLLSQDFSLFHCFVKTPSQFLHVPGATDHLISPPSTFLSPTFRTFPPLVLCSCASAYLSCIFACPCRCVSPDCHAFRLSLTPALGLEIPQVLSCLFPHSPPQPFPPTPSLPAQPLFAS